MLIRPEGRGTPRRPAFREAADWLADLALVLRPLRRCAWLLASSWALIDVAVHGPWWLR